MLFRTGGMAPAGQGEAPAWFMKALQSAMAYGGVAISMFVGWTLLQRLAAMGFSQEGRSYWMLKSAPVSSGRLLAAKFLAAYLPALALGWGFVGILALLQPGGPVASVLWFSLAVDALCLGAVTGIYLTFGVAGARLDWEDPRQMIGGGAGCLAALSTGLALLVGLALFAGTQVGLVLLRWPLLAGQLVGLVLGGAFCLACTLVPLRLVPLRLVCDRVARLGEN
jgi:ABC-2 type transport system permease protein